MNEKVSDDNQDNGVFMDLLRPDQDNSSLKEVYETLKTIARHHVQGNTGVETLNPTALVHEVYLKLYTSSEKNWLSESHFYRVAAKATRQVITDYARRKLSQKRNAEQADIEAFFVGASQPLQNIVFLDQAIAKIEAQNSHHALLLELKLFGGFSSEEIAKMTSVSRSTVEREWKNAKAHIRRSLESES
jgi:RNA polymerase sigma factor (TIGR02999 family)